MIMPRAHEVAETTGHLTCEESWHATPITGTKETPGHRLCDEFWHGTGSLALAFLIHT